MERLKRMGWMLVGVLIGGLAATAVHARQPQSQPPQRLVVVASDRVSGWNAEIVRDMKSDGCWLLIGSRTVDGAVAVAPAPPGTCYQR
jgi:hypothetical protein